MRVVRLAVVLLILCGSALAATTTALDPLASAVGDRLAALEPGTPRARHDGRVLERIAATLAKPTTSLAGDLQLVRRAAQRIARGLRQDAELTALADAAVDDLETLALTERGRLATWGGHLPNARDEPLFASALAAIDRRLALASERVAATGRARDLAAACRRMDETRDALDIWGDPPPPPAPMPDFALADVNPASPSYAQQVSPRDYLGKISAWYFGKAG
jgi:hypothetical protein